MSNKLKIEVVREYISQAGEFLLSESYTNNKTLLEIWCKKCDMIYEQTYDRYKRGYRHNKCPYKINPSNAVDKSIYISRGVSKKKPITKTCIQCHNEFIINDHTQRRRKMCGMACLDDYHQDRAKNGTFSQRGRKGGIESVKKQNRRSKNEIYFAKLCADQFGVENITCNNPMFNGWDADVIITSLKIAISWNGVWHYKTICNGHNVSNVQHRDKMKDKIIKKLGYQHYVIKDMGKADIAFVEREFKQFCNLIYFL